MAVEGSPLLPFLVAAADRKIILEWLLDLLLYLPPLASAPLTCPNRPNRVHASAHHGASPPSRSPQVPPAGLSRAAAKRVCGKLADHEVRARSAMRVLQHARAHHGASPAPPCECSSMHVLTTTPRPSPQVRGELLAAKKLAALRLLDASTEDGAFLFGPAESMAHWVVAACDGDTGVSTRCDCNSDCNSDCMLIASLIMNRRREDCRWSSPEAPGSKFG